MIQTVDIDHDLADQMIDRVCQAHASGEPLAWRTGPYSDRSIKEQFGLRGHHQSVICTTLNHLIEAGLLRIEETGRQVSVIMGDRLRSYPVVHVLPA